MKSEEIADVLTGARVVPVLRKIPENVVGQVVDALASGGVQALEITLDSAGAEGTIEKLREKYAGRIAIGAGTVLSVAQLDMAVHAGAEFLVCPHFDMQLVERAKALRVPIVPGVLTPTEARTATLAGAEVVKVFPAGTMGPSYIKDLLGPLSDLKIMVTGGITEENALAFIRAGAIAIGMGSALFPQTEVASQDWDAIANRAKGLLSTIREW